MYIELKSTTETTTNSERPITVSKIDPWSPKETSGSRDRFDLDFATIHDSVFPVDVRLHDRIVARIKSRDEGTLFKEIQVWKLSPLGVELVNDTDRPYQKGDKVDLEITIGGQRTYFEGLVVDLLLRNASISLIGIRISNRTQSSASTEEKRRSVRWICSEDFYPTCVSPTPGRYNEYIYFRIRDISREGFQLVCSLRNKYLIVGMQLNLTASFPMVGDLSLSVRVARIGIDAHQGKDRLIVGTEFIELSKTAKNTIGQYLLQFTNADSLEDLRDAGFFPASVSKGTDYYFLKSESDYEAVLNLRLRAHQAGKTVDKDLAPSDMGDMFDTNSRIVIGMHKGEVIASARVHFNVLEEHMEHEKYVEWPTELPRRDQIFELTRVCTDPKFRSNDLLASLFRFIAATCLQPQRPWVLVSSTDQLVDFYKKIGLQDTGLRYSHPVFKGNQNVLLSNAYDILLGRDVHPLYWNALWKDVYQYLVESGVLTPDPMDRARIRAYWLLSPITNLFQRYSRKPRAK